MGLACFVVFARRGWYRVRSRGFLVLVYWYGDGDVEYGCGDGKCYDGGRF